MTSSPKHLLAGLSACFVALSSSAAAINVTDFSGSETVVEMSGAGTPGLGNFSYGGLTFSESSTGSGGPGWRNLTSYGIGFTDNAAISNITIDLGGAFDKAGLTLYIGPATYQVNFFDHNSNLLGSVTESLDSITYPTPFAGWQSSIGISKIQIIETTGDNGLVGGFNNVRYENAVAVAVPEPEAFAMSMAGIAVLALARRRNKAR